VDSRPSAAGDTVVVQPGDSLWSIAEEALVDLTGHADDRTISRYWRRVVDANRAALVDPGNPDLIFAGQVITLPAP
jgi:nucleoid-associated protein YgaU